MMKGVLVWINLLIGVGFLCGFHGQDGAVFTLRVSEGCRTRFISGSGRYGGPISDNLLNHMDQGTCLVHSGGLDNAGL